MTPLLNLIWSINSNVNYRSVDMGQAKSECLIVMIGIGVLYTNLKKCPLAYGPCVKQYGFFFQTNGLDLLS